MKLIIFCGIPGSGKTTISKQMSEENNYVRISMDEEKYIRHTEMIEPIVNYLKSGKSVIADSLYDLREHRERLLDAVKDVECERICIVIDTPLEESIRRNNTRPEPLPRGLIECIYEHFEHPSMDEGWDEIVHIDNK